MGKINDALKKTGLKVNGKEPSGKTAGEILDNFAEDYAGGGSGETYTAGNGIGITDENVINADIKVLETSNITGLTTEQCESLNVGDIVVKLTSNQKHTYTVSYKEAGVGMCLTYVDASVIETVSYDCIEDNWVYNSTDVTEVASKSDIPSAIHLYEHNIRYYLDFGCSGGIELNFKMITTSANKVSESDILSYLTRFYGASTRYYLPAFKTLFNNQNYFETISTAYDQTNDTLYAYNGSYLETYQIEYAESKEIDDIIIQIA